MSRMHIIGLAVPALMFLAAAAGAGVADSNASGFTLKRTLTVDAAPAKAFDAFTAISGWWDPAHSYSGKAAALSIDAKPNGCFCEKLGPKSGLVHMTVLYADPGKMLRMTGGLGPLQQMAVSAVMTLEFKPNENRTDVDFTYAVGGYYSEGLDKLAPAVDQVLSQQLDRYQRFASTGKP